MKQMYRFARLLACAGLIAGTLSLWGCGSASTYDPITPTRIVAFGDALVDVGQIGRTATINGNVTNYRYTVNNVVAGTTTNTGNTFVEYISSHFGFGSVTYALDSLTAANRLPSSGAYSYGEFGALVSGAAAFNGGTSEPTNLTPQVADARGCQKLAANKATRTAGAAANAYCAYSLQAQIDLFLAQGAPSSNDLFVISIGTGDIMATGIRNLTIDATTPLTLAAGLDDVKAKLIADGVNTQLQAAANALAVQVKRLTDAGAKYVLILGPPNVGRSPWATTTGNANLFQNLSYNTGSGVISMGSEGLARIQATFGNQQNNPVLFVEISGLVNTYTDGTNATFTNKTAPLCTATALTSTTVSAISIGTGIKPAAGAAIPGQLSAALCTTATLNGDVSTYVYADGVNFTPVMQSLIYSQAVARMRLAAWIN
jgi:outer membrane lipase/esterase